MRNLFRRAKTAVNAGQLSATAAFEPVFRRRFAQWRRFLYWARVVGWVLLAAEYVSPVTPQLQGDEVAAVLLALACIVGGRRYPILVTGELLAVSYLVLEERNHFMPIALCLLVVGHAAFATKIPFPLLYANAIAGLSLGWATSDMSSGALIRVTLILGVAMFGSRVFRMWLEQLTVDLSRGFTDLLDRGFSVYPAFLDFAATTSNTLDSMLDGPEVERLRDRVAELETANRAAAAALSIANHTDVGGIDVNPERHVTRPHFLAR